MRSAVPSKERELILAMTGSPTQNPVLLMEWLIGTSDGLVTPELQAMMASSADGIAYRFQHKSKTLVFIIIPLRNSVLSSHRLLCPASCYKTRIRIAR
jgi:hypothetical protein